ERAYFVQGGDAAGGGQFQRSRRAEAPEPVEVGALHHSFLIHIGAQKARAIRFERVENLFGGETGGLSPALHHDAAAFGIERDEDAVAADGFAQGLQEWLVDGWAGLEDCPTGPKSRGP